MLAVSEEVVVCHEVEISYKKCVVGVSLEFNGLLCDIGFILGVQTSQLQSVPSQILLFCCQLISGSNEAWFQYQWTFWYSCGKQEPSVTREEHGNG